MESLVPFLLAAVCARLAAAAPVTDIGDQRQTCGFSSCHELKEGMLNVHIVPHSHDDVGWLKTVDQYYYGQNNYIQLADVSKILSSVFDQLMTDPAKRYIQVETAFLWMWWQHQNQSTQEQYRQLVQSGRVQITNGGWSMPDEATTNYQSLIDNFSWGFKFLNDSFGPCGIPNIGWQIDPFGHSRETASIMAAMGFQGTFLGRLDYQDYATRKGASNLEVLWHASDNLGAQANLFTSALYDEYGPPRYCCWDTRCSDSDISNYNADLITNYFISYVTEKAKHYKTNNVMITMGTDFTYMDARRYYTNIDKLIELVNERQQTGSNINLIYSTPTCYVKAVNDAQPTISTKSDDFLPYANEYTSYWTGYYTSRPTLKFFERLGNNFLQVCKQLSALTGDASQNSTALDNLRDAMGILQHHDAITGTEKSAVAKDYAKTLTSAISGAQQLAQKALNILLSPKSREGEGARAGDSVELKSCLLLNISQCDMSEQNDNFTVTVYNPLSRLVSHYVRLPVKDGSYSVTDLDGAAVMVQLVPIPSPVLQLEGRHSEAQQELVFRAVDIHPLGIRSYRVARTSAAAIIYQPASDSYISNTHLALHIDASTGLLSTVVANGSQINVRHNFLYYDAYSGLNGGYGTRSNGAYVFKPSSNTPTQFTDKATYSVYKGEVVEEIHQTFNDWTSQVIRIYKGEEHAEFEWLVGPIHMSGRGTQPISRFSSSLRSDGVFYTDSNGREMLKRKLNYRQSWNVTITQAVSGNYYPVTSRIVIKDEEEGLEMAVLTDRSQGGSSLAEGQIELMIHRRLDSDDGLGVAEALNDVQPARGRHYLVVGTSSGHGGTSMAARQRLLAQKKLLQPWIFLREGTDWPTGYRHEYSGLQKSLPDNIQLLTLEPWGDNTILLRLEHIMEKSDDTNLSQNVTVDLKMIVAPFTVVSVRETTLDGNQWLEDVNKLSWKTTDGSNTASAVPHIVGSAVSLSPMQIRTFVVKVSYGSAV